MTKNDLKNIQALITLCRQNKISSITVGDVSIKFEPIVDFIPDRQAMPKSPSERAKDEMKLLLQTATDLPQDEIDKLL